MIQLIKGDCLEVMKDIPDGSVDAIITDPPYGTTWAKWDCIIDVNEMWNQLNRIARSNAAIALFSSQPFTTRLIESNIKNFKYTWYWIKDNKGNYLNAKRQPLRQIEEVNLFNKHRYYPQGLTDAGGLRGRGSGAKTTMVNYSDTWVQEKTGYPSNVLYYGLDRTGLHPTAKPVALMEYLIKTYTNEGETVLDFTMGSFTTAIACLNTKRNFIGIELDKHYFEIGTNRLQEHLKTLDYTPEIKIYNMESNI